MGTAKKDNLNLKTPSTAICADSVFGPGAYTDVIELADSFRSVSPEFADTIEASFGSLFKSAESVVSGIKGALEAAYSDMWDVSSFYTGNFRDSIKLVGDFSIDPVECDIEFDMGNFTTPRVLPSLKTRTIVRTYKTKAGNTTKTYRYPAGTMVKITGEDYSERVPPVPFALDYLDEIKHAAYKRKGF